MAADPNLGKNLPKVDPNDPFDRQRFIDGWDQSKIEKQVALVLGCGGLGCTVAFALARLGLKKIVLIDKDIVECSNLNRQILFSKTHIGKNKVDAAADGLKPHLVGTTEVVALHLDAVKEWGRIVEIAKESTVIFNNIDVGQYFDYAVLILAKSLNLPLSMGSSYARTWVVEFFKPPKSSFTLVNKDGKPEIFDKITPELIQTYKDLTFIPPDNNPASRAIGSNVIVCSIAGLMTVNQWCQSLFDFEMPNYYKGDLVGYWKPDDYLAWPAPDEET